MCFDFNFGHNQLISSTLHLYSVIGWLVCVCCGCQFTSRCSCHRHLRERSSAREATPSINCRRIRLRTSRCRKAETSFQVFCSIISETSLSCKKSVDHWYWFQLHYDVLSWFWPNHVQWSLGFPCPQHLETIKYQRLKMWIEAPSMSTVHVSIKIDYFVSSSSHCYLSSTIIRTVFNHRCL